MAVERSLGWATVKKSNEMTGKCKIFVQAREMSDIIKAVKSINNYINKKSDVIIVTNVYKITF